MGPSPAASSEQSSHDTISSRMAVDLLPSWRRGCLSVMISLWDRVSRVGYQDAPALPADRLPVIVAICTDLQNLFRPFFRHQPTRRKGQEIDPAPRTKAGTIWSRK